MRALLKLELNLDHKGIVFSNQSVVIEDLDEELQRSDRTLYVKSDIALDQAFNRIQERLNTMLQLALNELHKTGRARFKTNEDKT